MTIRSSGNTASFCRGGAACLLRMPAMTVAMWRSCEALGIDRGGEGGPPRDVALVETVLTIQRRITRSIDWESPERQQLAKALSTLWAPLDRLAAARPVLTLWFNEAGWRCPYEVRHAVGTEAPLGQLPVRWRFVTLLALNDVFGADPDENRAMSASASRLVRRAAPRQVRMMTRRPRQNTTNRALMRSAEYERLAREILAHPDWIAADKLLERKWERVRACLIDAALARNSPASPGATLSPASDEQAIQKC
jgi:hypothetical protein